MSVDVNWSSLTDGPDGQQLSEAIRDFIHDKFQEIPFPRFIQSVNVVAFDLGTIAPDIEIKDICEPYPEFYEDAYADGSDEDEDEEEEDEEEERGRRERERRRKERRERQRRAENPEDEFDDTFGHTSGASGGQQQQRQQNAGHTSMSPPGYFENRYPGFRPTAFSSAVDQLTSPPQLQRTGTNLHYFHSSLSSGFSGALTPLAPFSQQSSSLTPSATRPFHRSEDYSPSQSPPSSTGDSSSSPMPGAPASLSRMKSADSSGMLDDGTREPPPTPFDPNTVVVGGVADEGLGDSLASLRSADGDAALLPPPRLRLREPRDTDVQVVARVRYAGDMRMEMTMELLLDYPAPSFVSLPVRVTVTGFTFDGTAVVAYIRRRAHFCFVDDGDDAVNPPTENDGRGGGGGGGTGGGGGMGGAGGWSGGSSGAGRMLKEIKIESEIGEKGKGKQVLKNVGKVERFVLERVRRILEDEFIFPSSWTFLI